MAMPLDNPMVAWGACYPEGNIGGLRPDDDPEDDPEDEVDEREWDDI